MGPWHPLTAEELSRATLHWRVVYENPITQEWWTGPPRFERPRYHNERRLYGPNGWRGAYPVLVLKVTPK